MAIAAACLVLRERAAFATVLGSFARTLLQHSFSAAVGMCCQSSSFWKNVKDGNFRFHDLLGDVGCVSFALRRCSFYRNFIKFQVHSISMLQNLEAGPRRGTYRCWFLGCFMMFLVPTPFPNDATVIRTRHCRLRRSCIEGSSGSVGFKIAIVFQLMKCELWHRWLREMRN